MTSMSLFLNPAPSRTQMYYLLLIKIAYKNISVLQTFHKI
jgi:hypothetical protein